MTALDWVLVTLVALSVLAVVAARLRLLSVRLGPAAQPRKTTPKNGETP